ncbi:hypothetical protein GCM10009122_49540 [Fulvivirga kasyanovii]|uniref:Chaperone NapD n=1 Tax=Fulvivirga kasyanovii TaxID=396812 RepID=A0ABW9RS75_9BACT|nr:chaperone NapD [Fulvivirga kasyanovii]MTI27014.1 hypothetical protein [Fulvivirga kasyanovii]
MPIKSYLVFPKQGKKALLEASLKDIPSCEIIQAENKDLIILVSETADQGEEDALMQKLSEIESLDHLNLVAGFNDDNLNH